MPLPLAPFLPLMMRIGTVAVAGYAARRWILSRAHPGRLDQRAEDALDDLGEGLTLHRPQSEPDSRQTNATLRWRRTIGFRGRTWELDAGVMARFRLRGQQS